MSEFERGLLLLRKPKVTNCLKIPQLVLQNQGICASCFHLEDHHETSSAYSPALSSCLRTLWQPETNNLDGTFAFPRYPRCSMTPEQVPAMMPIGVTEPSHHT
jgi:hypothetical protein